MFLLALRNLWRNKVRTGITLAAISGGLTMIIMGNNLNHGMYQDLIKKGISTIAGHVVVQPKGWQDDPDAVERSIPDAAAVTATVQGAWPDATVVQRTFFGGLLTSPTSSAGVGITAVQPDLEVTVSDWHTKVSDGEWLKPDDDRGILIGAKLAETLDVGVGKKLVLMGQGKEDVTSRLFRVRGIIKTGSAQADGILAFTTLGAAQAFLEQPGGVSQVSLHLESADDSDAALAAVEAAFPGAAELEVLGWKEAVKEVYSFTQTDRRTNNTFMGIIGIIVAFGIINTILMSVMERIKEFGVMLALGTPPLKLRGMILTEGLLLGILGAAIGLGFGSLITSYLVSTGIDYSEMMGESLDMAGVSISTVIKAQWDWLSMGVYCGVAIFLSVLSTVYPAWKAGALRPVEAMRHT
jgi:ABC-type lipoprotein release transport system permease subunit